MNSPNRNTEVTTAEDPTKAILSDSALNKKYLCDYVINVATGCRHGCRFCYVPATPNIRMRGEMLEETAGVEDGQKEWGEYVLYRDNIPDELPGLLERKRTWNRTQKGCGIVGVSFGTDCYMDRRAGNITREVVKTLSAHEKYTRVLTRNPKLAVADLDAFHDAGEYVTIGSSINSLDESELLAIEQNAPAPQHRIEGLRRFADAGVNTFVSMSPTYPTMDKSDMRTLLERLKTLDPGVIFHEPINPRGGNFQMTIDAAWEAGEQELGAELASLRDEEVWKEYAITHFKWVQEIGMELDLPIHLWPDETLMNKTTGDVHRWISEWWERQSPEEFADRETPKSPLPTLPQR